MAIGVFFFESSAQYMFVSLFHFAAPEKEALTAGQEREGEGEKGGRFFPSARHRRKRRKREKPSGLYASIPPSPSSYLCCLEK